MSPIFTEVSIVIVLAAACGLVAHFLRQPTILGYLVAGLVIGPLGYLHFNSAEVLDGFAEIGIALLLFMIGLELNVSELKHIGRPALIGGIGQVILSFAGGYFLIKALGFATLPALYVSIALSFSSTIIVVKLLHEKHDLDSLYGKIVVGFLLVQDVIAIFILVFVTGLTESSELLGTTGTFALLIVKGALIVGGVLFAGQKFFPWMMDKIGRSQEMLFMFSIAWGLGFAMIMSSDLIGYSLEMGGLLAGLALANSSENFQIAGKIRPLRDFFIVMFFVVLGSKMVLANLGAIILPAVILSIFVLTVEPLIVMLIMGFLGYRPRTSFLAGLTVAQVSEFSLILMIVGKRIGHITDEHVAIVTFVAVVTILGSSYMIWHGNQIYHRLRSRLGFLEVRKRATEEIGEVEGLEQHIVLIGAHRTGSSIIHALQNLNRKYVVVDFNPGIVRQLKSRGVPVIYGDVVDAEIQERAGLRRAKLVISTIPDMHDATATLRFLKENNHHAKVIVTAESDWEGLRLYKEGADYVLLPHFLGGQQLASIIKHDHEFKELHQLKLKDMQSIKEGIL